MSDRPQLTIAQIEQANRLFAQVAIEQRDEASPPFRPRLSKPPAQEAESR